MDKRHGLCFGLPTSQYDHWELLPSISDVVESQLEKGEYRTYLRVAETVLQYKQERRTLLNAIYDDLSLPLAMWCHLLEGTSTDATVAVYILTYGTSGLFDWKFDPTRELIRNAGFVRFNSRELGWWKFNYLFRYFDLGKSDSPESPPEAKIYETGYPLLIAIYHNLTSDHPLITEQEQRQEVLENLFGSFWDLISTAPLRTLEVPLRFLTEICCVDSFWSESMTDETRYVATLSLSDFTVQMSLNTVVNCMPFANIHDPSLTYKWYSRDFKSPLLAKTPPLFVLMLLPQNRHHLSTILLNHPDSVAHFSKCLHNLANRQYTSMDGEENIYIYLTFKLMDLLKPVGPKNPLFTIL